MNLVGKQSFWVMLSAIALWALAEVVLGSDRNRNLFAFLAIIVSLLNALRYAPYAWAAFREGGERDNWKLLIGHELFWLGFGARETWLWAVRDYGRPDWMIQSPLNSFFVLWILGAGLLCYSAASDGPVHIPPHRVYWAAVTGIAGVLFGFALKGWLWP